MSGRMHENSCRVRSVHESSKLTYTSHADANIKNLVLPTVYLCQISLSTCAQCHQPPIMPCDTFIHQLSSAPYTHATYDVIIVCLCRCDYIHYTIKYQQSRCLFCCGHYIMILCDLRSLYTAGIKVISPLPRVRILGFNSEPL